MKKNLPYIIVSSAIVLLCILLILTAKYQPQKLNERITLRQRDKLPYGTFVAQKLLPAIFPQAHISRELNPPGDWENLSEDSSRQAIIFMAKAFRATRYELDKISAFAGKGNYVFIVAKSLSSETNQLLNCMDNSASFDGFYGIDDDSLQISLDNPPFTFAPSFIYPGKKFESYFSNFDSSKTTVLGHTLENKANFIQINIGKGSIFIHLAPLAFSNYFLLHKNNIHYFQNAIAVIPSNVKQIAWSEYYLTRPVKHKPQEPSIFSVLFQYPAFKWAFLTAIATLLLYTLLEMRRKQRVIPDYTKPVNESAEFIKTMGRLYYEGGDHKNMATKMSTYFLDHIRQKYKLSTSVLDAAFITALHTRSNYPVNDLNHLIFFINHIEEAQLSDHQLLNFHRQLEQFYQTT